MRPLAPVRTGAPTGQLASLAEAKVAAKVESDEEDAFVADLVVAATAALDGYGASIGVALLEQTWAQGFDGFPCGRELRLPLGPLIAVTTVAYFDAAGAVQAFANFHAVSDAIGPKLVLEDGASWPDTATRPDAVTVTWTCGHDPASAEIARVKRAVLLTTTHWYENRGAVNVGNIVSELPLAVGWLIAPLRKIRV